MAFELPFLSVDFGQSVPSVRSAPAPRPIPWTMPSALVRYYMTFVASHPRLASSRTTPGPNFINGVFHPIFWVISPIMSSAHAWESVTIFAERRYDLRLQATIGSGRRFSAADRCRRREIADVFDCGINRGTERLGTTGDMRQQRAALVRGDQSCCEMARIGFARQFASLSYRGQPVLEQRKPAVVPGAKSSSTTSSASSSSPVSDPYTQPFRRDFPRRPATNSSRPMPVKIADCPADPTRAASGTR